MTFQLLSPGHAATLQTWTVSGFSPSHCPMLLSLALHTTWRCWMPSPQLTEHCVKPPRREKNTPVSDGKKQGWRHGNATHAIKGFKKNGMCACGVCNTMYINTHKLVFKPMHRDFPGSGEPCPLGWILLNLLSQDDFHPCIIKVLLEMKCLASQVHRSELNTKYFPLALIPLATHYNCLPSPPSLLCHY